jgi:pyrimidine-nucleoside phosphorylase
VVIISEQILVSRVTISGAFSGLFALSHAPVENRIQPATDSGSERPLPAMSESTAFRAVDLIRKKRDGAELSAAEIKYFVRGSTTGEIPDYQAAAWLMAALIRGLTRAETAALTDAMLRSGEVLDFSDLSAKKVDKHSTGGVGDKTSLVLAPVIAAGGLVVPMISGRGLGHTGGTLDKLESIPGFNVNLPVSEFRRVLEKCGCSMIGQTAQIAPADRKFYALRDVTGTVESPYLICASIMSKKLAEGIDGLVLDVKTGSGAFMKKEEDAVFLASLMAKTGQRMGKSVVALITDMNQPLGRMAGNSVEVIECVEVLRGEGPKDLRELCLQLCAWMFVLGERTTSVEEGKELAAKLIASGEALEKFREMVGLQGGDVGAIEDVTRLPKAKHKKDVVSSRDGYVGAVNCEAVGTACVVLGGGREKKEDAIDHAVGLEFHKRIGERVAIGEPICTMFYNSEDKAAQAQALIENSYRLSETSAIQPALIHRVINNSGETN